MWAVPYALAALFFLAGVVCGLAVLVHSFKDSVGQGLLCLLVPFYIVYYVLAQLRHPRRRLLATGLIGGPLLAAVMMGLSPLFEPRVDDGAGAVTRPSHLDGQVPS